MYCAPILFACLVISAFAQQPLVQLIEEAIYESNQELEKNHQDEQTIQAFNLQVSYIRLNSAGGRIGNFSTVSLVGTPVVTQEKKTDGTSYTFDLAVGLTEFYAQLKYDVSVLLLLSSSGTISFLNTGNAIRGKFVVNTYNGNVPCDAVLEVAEVKSLGSMEFELGDSFMFKILSKFLSLVLSLSKSFISSFLNKRIEELIKTPGFSSKFTELACKPFDFNI